jgi:hypothetical protein
MIEKFRITRDGWPAASSDEAEAQAFTRLRIAVGESLVTRNVSKRGGGESDAITTSLLPLAEFLADGWWPLLYEPQRQKITDAFRARHRLDTGMRGYAFPAFALWSGGETAVLADWASFPSQHAQVSFIEPRPEEIVQLERDAVETDLMDLVETVIDRTNGSSPQLLEAWDRVRRSIADPDEFNYCVASGRLGLDPYDPDGPDLAELAAGIQEPLFQDISEVVEVSDLVAAAEWTREQELRLKLFPETDLSAFGAFAKDELLHPAWYAGQVSAELLRAHTGVPTEDPRLAVDQLLGGIIAEGGELTSSGPAGVTALLHRSDSSAKIGAVARSARQRRFRTLAATYLAWTASGGEDHAATEAHTRRQQASRAFAAEMVAPRQALLARAPREGFDDDDLLFWAGEFVCPYETIKWQAYRAGIPLRGVELPRPYRAPILTAAAR